MTISWPPSRSRKGRAVGRRAGAGRGASAGDETDHQRLFDRLGQCEENPRQPECCVIASSVQFRSPEGVAYDTVNTVEVLIIVQDGFQARQDRLQLQCYVRANLFMLTQWSGKLNQERVDNVNVWLSLEPEQGLPGGDDVKAKTKP